VGRGTCKAPRPRGHYPFTRFAMGGGKKGTSAADKARAMMTDREMIFYIRGTLSARDDRSGLVHEIDQHLARI